MGGLPHRGRASDSETDRVVRLTAPQGGSDEDQNGFLEAEILDSHRVMETDGGRPEVSAVGVEEETATESAKADSGKADRVPEMVEELMPDDSRSRTFFNGRGVLLLRSNVSVQRAPQRSKAPRSWILALLEFGTRSTRERASGSATDGSDRVDLRDWTAIDRE